MLWFIFFGLTSPLLFAQNTDVFIKQKGTPYIRNYTAKEYKADMTNHAVVQDNRGVMYFGNNSGVLEYDGSSWRLIKLSNGSRVYSLAFDKTHNRVYVGGVGDFGYLTPNTQGKTVYVSLLSKVPKGQQDFKNVWNTIVTLKHQIIFQTHKKVYIFQKNNLQILKPLKKDNIFHMAFYINKLVYVREQGVGLQKLTTKNQLKLVSNGKFFVKKSIYSILPYDSKNLLIITRSKGLLLYDGQNITPWQNTVNKHLLKYRAYYCKSLSNKYIILGTLNNGIFILDKQGNIIQHIDNSKGLISSSIYNAFIDKENKIWLATTNGIGYLMIHSPFTIYNHCLGLKSSLSASITLSNSIFAGTMQNGLFVQRDNATHNFSKIVQLNNILAIYKESKNLLVGHNEGIWVYNWPKKEGEWILKRRLIWKFIKPLNHKHSLLVGTRKGLIKLVKAKQKWKFTPVRNSVKSIPYLAEYKANHFLASDDNGMLSKITLNTNLDSVTHQKTYGQAEGLPHDQGNRVFQTKDEIIVGTFQGIYRYNVQQDRFEKHPDFIQPIGNQFVRYAKNDKKGNLWLWAGQPNDLDLLFVKKTAPHQYQVIRTPFQKLKNTFMEFGTHINPIDDKNVLFGAPEGAVHYDPSIRINYDRPYPCLIRKVETIREGKADSLIFWGNFVDTLGQVIAQQPLLAKPTLPYANNHLRFRFAATYYEDSEQLKYSYRLRGFESSWSNWTLQTQKEYTNLPEGQYIFEVKARNIYDKESLMATYSFRVLPPWYRTFWAYSGYIVTGLLLIWGVVKLNTRRLQRQKRSLETTVIARTAEIRQQNRALSQQKEEILNQSEELKTMNERLGELGEFKEQMTHMIVHDLKNPLASILGMTTTTQVGPLDKTTIYTTAQQMLYMIQNILDVQKAEEAEIQINLQEITIGELVLPLIAQQQVLAQTKGIRLHHNLSLGDVVVADPDILQRVLANLISNAIKFTPVQGEIFLTSYYLDTPPILKIMVQDNGIGIPPDQLENIFDKFYSVNKNTQGFFRSTGLGLTFCKIAVEKLGGTIGVTSTIGQGSTFWFTLPLHAQNKPLNSHAALPEDNSITKVIAQVKHDLQGNDRSLVEAIIQQIRKQGLNHRHPTKLARIFDRVKQKVSISEEVAIWMQMLLNDATNDGLFEALLDLDKSED